MGKIPRICAAPLTLIIIGLAIYLFSAMYFHGAAVIYGPDAENILAPLFYDISRSIHEHGLLAGMYNPGQLAGLSLWDTPYFHPLYPFYFNWLGSDTSIFDTVARLRHVNFIHLAIYGSGCYLLSRQIGVRQWLSVAIGLVSPWSPAVQSMLHWPQILASFAWIPWVLAFEVRLYQAPRIHSRSVSILGFAAAFALLVYAQPAQNMVLVVVGSLLMWVYIAGSTLLTGQKEDWKTFLGSTVSLLFAVLLACLLCGEYLLAVVTYLSKAIRWWSATSSGVGSQRMPLVAFRAFSFNFNQIFDLVVYHASKRGAPGNLYVGAVVVLGAIMRLSVKGRSRTIDALFFSAAVAVLFCLFIFAPVLQWIPVANKVRELSWWSCYTALILLPLGAYGLQQMLDSQGPDWSNSRFKWHPTWMIASGSVLTLFLILVSDPGSRLLEALVLCISFGTLAACMARPIQTRQFHQPLAVMLVVLSAVIPISSYGKLSPKGVLLLQPDHVLRRNEALKIASVISDGNEYRIGVSINFPDYKNFTATLANVGLRGIRGDESPLEYDKFRLLFFPTQATADLYGVKYLIVPHAESGSGDMQLDPSISLRTNSHVLRRLFYVQGGVKAVDSPVDTLLNIKDDGTWHFFVSIGDLPNDFDLSPYASGIAKVSFPVIAYSSSVVTRGTIDPTGPGLLVLNEGIAGRWSAMIDGKRIKPFRINGFQTAFPVSGAGPHDFVITRPTHLL